MFKKETVRKNLKLTAIAIMAMFVISACSSDDKPETSFSIVGTWYQCERGDLTSIVTFNFDKTFIIKNPDGSTFKNGTYEVEYNVGEEEFDGIKYKFLKVTIITDADTNIDFFAYGRDNSGDYLIFEHMNKWRRYNPCE